MENLKVKIEKEISMEILENIFVTAIEGGSNYWYTINESAYKAVKRTIIGEAFSTSLFKCVCQIGMTVPINDAEDEEEVLGYLDYSKFNERIQKMYAKGDGWAMDVEVEGNGDANSSDVVFQYLVMGDLVFG
jgi:hypothetical protein